MTINSQALTNSLLTVFSKLGFETSQASSFLVAKNEDGLDVIASFNDNQILMFSPICRVNEVIDENKVNREAMRVNNMIPLSNITIAQYANEEYYVMSGALAISSTMHDLETEILTLASNTMDVCETFANEYLKN